MTKKANDPVEQLITAVATRSENRFIKDPEEGEKPVLDQTRRLVVTQYVSYIYYFGELPPLDTKVGLTLSDKRRGQVLTRLASGWLEYESRIPNVPSFVTAEWFRPYLHKQLMERESARPAQKNQKYKTS